MHTTFSRKVIVMTVATLIGVGTLGTSVASFAQESAMARKTASIKANFRLEEAVQKAFDKQKHFDSSGIRVVSRDGVVSLEGTMPDDKQIARATDVATSTPGVKSVTNSLTVREEGH
jgi:hyperosmotically inducible periplasmic protein